LVHRFTLTPNGSFSLRQTFLCGQCFRWDEMPDGSFVGVFGSTVARIWETDGTVTVEANTPCADALSGYLDLSRDYDAIRNAVSIDAQTEKAAAFGAGIRILKQDAWEALCSFIISQCNNISRIKAIISKLCSAYGTPIPWNGEVYYTFPEAHVLAPLTAGELDFLKCGYRTPYILGAARAVAEGRLDLSRTAALTTDEAKAVLRTLDGVGEKVASCMLLFGLQKLDAFPVDVWVRRATETLYGKGFDPKSAFGPYAGIAQQYLFYYAREHKITGK